MRYVAVLNGTSADYRTSWTVGLLPAGGVGVVDTRSTVAARGIAVGSLLPIPGGTTDPAAIAALARAAALEAGTIPAPTSSLSILDRLVALEAGGGGGGGGVTPAQLTAALATVQLAATAATDAELAAAVATLTSALTGKQDAATAATDAELAAAVATITTALTGKQDASTAATDAELASAVATINAGLGIYQLASTAATDAELAAAIAGLGTAAGVNTGTTAGTIPVLGTGGVLAIGRLATGAPDGTKFVADDGTLKTPAGGGGGGNGIYGDGSDGNVTVSTSITLARDMLYDTLTVTVAGTIKANGYRIFCKTGLGNAGLIQAPGTAAVGSAAGALAGVGSVYRGTAGGAGGLTVGATSSGALTPGGGQGGTGGAGSSGAGASAGAASGVQATLGTIKTLPMAALGIVFAGNGSGNTQTTNGVVAGGSGGGSGGGDGTNAGGGGGGGGGVLIIVAKALTNTGTIAANGGTGGTGAAGNTGGGGGGGGGLVSLVYNTLNNTGTIQAAGGAGGAGTGTGTAGATGNAGNVVQVSNA